jgi:hypothetical protein
MTLDQLAAGLACARVVNDAWALGALLGVSLVILPCVSLLLVEWLSKRREP